ncbi:hypothetical protein L0F63_004753 [Massospora cicadina]|nr:hypothetical protein L0F63_004753 [Massospora cicadina]
MSHPFSSLNHLEISEASLYPKPGAPDSKVFKYFRKRREAWIQIPRLIASGEHEKVPKSPKEIIAMPMPKHDASAGETPVKRKRGRPRKVILPEPPEPLVAPPIAEPEVVEPLVDQFPKTGLVIDEKGEGKLAPDGSLLDGRTFAINTFTLSSRPGRIYLLASWHNDRRHIERLFPMLPIYETTQRDQDELFKMGQIKVTRKNFRTGLVPAREAFMVFGHLLVKHGRPGVDDYYKDPEMSPSKQLLARMALKESEESESSLSDDQETSHLSFQCGPITGSPPGAAELKSWMSNSAQLFNSQLNAFRRNNPQFYDPHTNQNLYPTRQVRPANDVCKVEESVLACLPPDLRATVLSLKRGRPESSPSRSSLYPLALNERQIQATIPLHASRFGQHLNVADLRFLSAASGGSGFAEAGFSTAPASTKPQSKPIRAMPRKGGRPPPNCGPPTADPVTGSRVAIPGPMGADPASSRWATPESCAISTGMRHPSSNSPDSSGEAADPNVCVFCNSTLAPAAALEHNGGLKLQAEDGRRRKISRSQTITCAECHHAVHLWCIQITDARTLDRMRSYSWVCNDCKRCDICESPDDEDTLLFCDGCDRAFHMACLDPPISKVPEGNSALDLQLMVARRMEVRYLQLAALSLLFPPPTLVMGPILRYGLDPAPSGYPSMVIGSAALGYPTPLECSNKGHLYELCAGIFSIWAPGYTVGKPSPTFRCGLIA